ncbi:hypothetical protein J1605_021895 [Eschrichtius robustus]|uniref:Cartilage acidic protein 1 n=1 Tax=Eschrichtius robustus TaxID=9764 RepID=A0AB34HBH8_ESCRO|nr:hypothetical protein J1605_021895 [Eschrichtius robustus]
MASPPIGGGKDILLGGDPRDRGCEGGVSVLDFTWRLLSHSPEGGHARSVHLLRYNGPNLVLKYDRAQKRLVNIAVDERSSPYYALRDRQGNAIGVTACDIDGDGREEIYFLNTNNAFSGTQDLLQLLPGGHPSDFLRWLLQLLLGLALSSSARVTWPGLGALKPAVPSSEAPQASEGDDKAATASGTAMRMAVSGSSAAPVGRPPKPQQLCADPSCGSSAQAPPHRHLRDSWICLPLCRERAFPSSGRGLCAAGRERSADREIPGVATYTDKLFKFRDNRWEDILSDEVNVARGVASLFAGRSVACVDRRGSGHYSIYIANYAYGNVGPDALIEMDPEASDLSRGILALRDVAAEAGVSKYTGRAMAKPAPGCPAPREEEGRHLVQTPDSAGGRRSTRSQCHLAANAPALGGLEGPWRAVQPEPLVQS